jgi:hypothetical protein
MKAPAENPAERFLKDVRRGSVPLRGRIKKYSQDCLESFRQGLLETFPEADGKQFTGAVVRLWVRWLASQVTIPSDQEATAFSLETGRGVGEILRVEYIEGVAGRFSTALLNKRLHLTGTRDYLHMKAWLQERIETLRGQTDPESRECGEILAANFSSIVLRALHNAGPGYAAEAIQRLPAMMKDLDLAIRNLAAIEPEASRHLKNNRLTILTRALHSGSFDYAGKVTETLPTALKDLDRQIERLESSSPEIAKTLRSNKRTVIYRALTNGRLDYLADAGVGRPKALKILPQKSSTTTRRK